MPFLSLLPPSFPLFPLVLSFLRSVPHRSVPLPFAPFRWKHLGLEDVIIEKHLFACGSSLVSLFVFCSAPLHSVPLKTFRNGRCNYWEAPLCMWVLFLRSVPLRTALIRSVPLPFAPFRWKHLGLEDVIIEKHLFACWSSLVSLFVFSSAPLHSVPLKTFRNGRCNYWEAPLCMWVLHRHLSYIDSVLLWNFGHNHGKWKT